MAADLEFFFDPVCPFCWITSRWVRRVEGLRNLEVRWRFISLAMLNEDDYDDKPEHYPGAHRRGLQMLRVAAAARAKAGDDIVGPIYDALGGAVWNAEPPPVAEGQEPFDAILAHASRAGDLDAIVAELGLPAEIAAAADDRSYDLVIRDDTTKALERVGGDVGTPILSFSPPDGPAFFGPVISEVPDSDDDVLRLFDAVETLGRWPGFAELKRSLRRFPVTPVTAVIAGDETQVS